MQASLKLDCYHPKIHDNSHLNGKQIHIWLRRLTAKCSTLAMFDLILSILAVMLILIPKGPSTRPNFIEHVPCRIEPTSFGQELMVPPQPQGERNA